MLIDPERIDVERHGYIMQLIRWRLRVEPDETIDEIYGQVMRRLRRMARRQVDLKLKRGEASLKALLAQCVRWSVVDYLRRVNAKKRRGVESKRLNVPVDVEALGRDDPSIEAILWPKPGKTIWAIGGIKVREVFGEHLEKIPHRALLRALAWGKGYRAILRDNPGLTRNQLRGRLYRARRKAHKLWERALAKREGRWEEARRDERRRPRVGGFRGGRHHARWKL